MIINYYQKIEPFVRFYKIKILEDYQIFLFRLVDSIFFSLAKEYIMVWCSACGTPVTIKLLCKALGTTHVSLGVSAYLLNDSYESNKNKYDDE